MQRQRGRPWGVGRSSGQHYEISPAGRAYIRATMESLGWGPTRTADEAGVDRSTLYRWLAGETKTTPHLPQLCAALRIKVSDVLDAEQRAVQVMALYCKLVSLSPRAAESVAPYIEGRIDQIETSDPLSEHESSSEAPASGDTRR